MKTVEVDHGEAVDVIHTDGGMTIRQYYKAAALNGILANSALEGTLNPDEVGVNAYAITAGLFADAMIQEDKESEENT